MKTITYMVGAAGIEPATPTMSTNGAAEKRRNDGHFPTTASAVSGTCCSDVHGSQVQRTVGHYVKALRHKLKSEPAEHRPYIRNVIATLDIMLGNRPADEREAARKQTLRNIETLERARSGYVA